MVRRIAIVAFPGCQALDVVGPYEVFAGARRALERRGVLDGAYEPRVVGLERGVLESESGLGLVVQTSLAQLARKDAAPLDTLLVAGGHGARTHASDTRVQRLLQRTAARAKRLAAVCTGTFPLAAAGLLNGRRCTGALLLAAAGLLKGRRANTHWAVREQLAKLGALPVPDRYVRDGKYACAAGVSAGIDLALALAIEIAGTERAQAIQLMLEYDPQPPLDAGNAERAPAALREMLRERMRAREARETASHA